VQLWLHYEFVFHSSAIGSRLPALFFGTNASYQTLEWKRTNAWMGAMSSIYEVQQSVEFTNLLSSHRDRRRSCMSRM
jgi:hypothetical protein